MILLFNCVNFRFQLLLFQGEPLRKLHESFKKIDSYANEEYPSNANIQTVTTKGSPGSLRKQFLFLCDVWILWFLLYSIVVSGSLLKGGIGSIWHISRKRKVWIRCLLQCPQRSLVRVIWDPFLSSLFFCALYDPTIAKDCDQQLGGTSWYDGGHCGAPFVYGEAGRQDLRHCILPKKLLVKP